MIHNAAPFGTNFTAVIGCTRQRDALPERCFGTRFGYFVANPLPCRVSFPTLAVSLPQVVRKPRRSTHMMKLFNVAAAVAMAGALVAAQEAASQNPASGRQSQP